MEVLKVIIIVLKNRGLKRKKGIAKPRISSSCMTMTSLWAKIFLVGILRTTSVFRSIKYKSLSWRILFKFNNSYANVS